MELIIQIVIGAFIVFLGLWLRSVEARLREKVDVAFCRGRKELLEDIKDRLMRIEGMFMKGVRQ